MALVYVLRDEVEEEEEDEEGGWEDCVAEGCGYLGGLYGDGDGAEDEATGLDEEEVDRLYIDGRRWGMQTPETDRQTTRNNQSGS